jgi:hypothetical protein
MRLMSLNRTMTLSEVTMTSSLASTLVEVNLLQIAKRNWHSLLLQRYSLKTHREQNVPFPISQVSDRRRRQKSRIYISRIEYLLDGMALYRNGLPRYGQTCAQNWSAKSVSAAMPATRGLLLGSYTVTRSTRCLILRVRNPQRQAPPVSETLWTLTNPWGHGSCDGK